jgi:hypothetical protein
MDMAIAALRDLVRPALLIFSEDCRVVRIHASELVSHRVALYAEVLATSCPMVPSLRTPTGEILSEVEIIAPFYLVSGRGIGPSDQFTAPTKLRRVTKTTVRAWNQNHLTSLV